MNHFVTEGAENVLDVPVVYEQNQLVLRWFVVSSLYEKFIVRIGSLVKGDFGKGVYLKPNLPEILDDFLNPVVQHVYLCFIVHDDVIYHISIFYDEW